METIRTVGASCLHDQDAVKAPGHCKANDSPCLVPQKYRRAPGYELDQTEFYPEQFKSQVFFTYKVKIREATSKVL